MKINKLFKNLKAFIFNVERLLSIPERKKLYIHFRNRINNFYSKKIPNSENYPYQIHDPYLVFEEGKDYEELFFVGENWLENNSSKPIALMIGFNNWKYGFITDYLKEYRTVYTPRKLSLSTSLSLFKLYPKPNVIIVWGYTENHFVRRYSIKKDIPLYRMEDGFIRSALLGASHATPYSLILDKKGLYYNPEMESDLEMILNNFDFQEDKQLLIEAEKCLKLIIDMKVSKYNTPSTKEINKLGIKIKKRIAILGQVDNDAAIRYGNIDNWSTEELIQLARYENPEADIIYRPHPEVYKGYQESKLKLKRIKYFAKISLPEEPLLEFLETIDHVYVINSLSGLEALLRGIKVTTVGAAFYAGWGLTDDRYKFERRDRELSLLELFAGIYLKYPKYLANLENSSMGLLTTCHKIKADAYIASFDINKKLFFNKEFEPLLENDYWGYFLLNNKDDLSLKDEKNMLSSTNFKKYFEGNNSNLFQLTLLYFVAGALQHDESRDLFIQKVRIYIHTMVLNEFLFDLEEYYPGDYLIKHSSWLLKENNEFEIANNMMSQYLKITSKENMSNEELHICQKKEFELNDINQRELIICKGNDTQEDKSFSLNNDDIKNLFEALENYKITLEYDNFINIAKKLLITNNASTLLFTRLCEMATLKMDTNSAIKIAKLIQKLDIYAHNRASVHMELENFDFNLSSKSFEYITDLFTLQLTLNPDRLNRSWAILKKYFAQENYYQFFSSIARLYVKNDIHQAVLYLELNKPLKSIGILKNLIDDGEKSDKLSVEYAKTLFTIGKHDEAKKVITEAISIEATHANYTEYLRQLKAKGKFIEAFRVSKEGLSKKIKLTDEGHLMPIYFGLGKIEEGFKCFHDTALKEKLIHAFGKDKYKSTHSISDIKNTLLIFSSGPAEEMRFASIYNELSKAIGFNNFKLTCDYRLKNILSRSFPQITFVAVKRTRFFTPESPLSNYNRLPSFELCNTLDNSTIKHVKSASQIKLVTELFFHFRKTYNDFSNKKPHLIVDQKRVDYFKKKLPQDAIFVGLSWRSSLTNAMRNIHYLSIEDMLPLFDIPNIYFVNLQYDECQHELDILRNKYNVEIIDFPELDQMNDFDGVAGLMKNLDLVISPFTAVIELAGSIGVKGLLFSNHGESFWRKVDGGNSDVWYDSVKIVSSGEIGNQKAIVMALKKEILKII